MASRERAGVLIIDNAKKLLVIKRHRNGESFYCIPGGHKEEGETPEQAAVRELLEETTLTISLDQLVATFTNQGRTEYYFLAKTFSGKAILGGEELERNCPENSYSLAWTTWQELQKLPFYPTQLLPYIEKILCDK